MTPPLALVALGSNLGDPAARLRAARSDLAELGRIARSSSIYRTAPVGGPPGQPDYLNAVVALEPRLGLAEPRSLLGALHEIERRHGRLRRLRWEARVLDLDLLALDELVREEPEITLPHPRMMERSFVLVPLCEAVPEWRHPLTRESACEALARLPMEGIERTVLGWGDSRARRAET
ncbi:MAG TPA: 2-amino-4-hydroxy-6-hydroxymethyldihydropteridine diphosphokinase [Trueperaceae bacterium]